MAEKPIVVRGARQHNLAGIDLEIPRNQMVVVTGLSGSGKSSLAMDTLYAEGQRRYVESLSAYARQFLGQMDKPDVDDIEGLSPAIAIDQKTTSHNPRSTVGTATEVYDYLRLLYARVGNPHCPECGKPIQAQTIDQMVDQVLQLPEGSRLQILSPEVRGRKGAHAGVFEEARRKGFVRVRVDGNIYDLADVPELDPNRWHRIEIVVDRLIIKDGIRNRLADSLETSLEAADGLAVVDVVDGAEIFFNQKLSCPDCGISLEELTPRSFSFNSPYGACPACDGLGTDRSIDPERVVPDPDETLEAGALEPWSRGNYYPQLLQAACDHFDIPLDVPFSSLSSKQQELLLYGSDDETVRFTYRNRFGRTRTRHVRFEGVCPNLERRYEEGNDRKRDGIEKYMSDRPCPSCGGGRLKPSSLAVTVGGKNIAEVTSMTIAGAYEFFNDLALEAADRQIGQPILREITARLRFMLDVGLEYLTLARRAGTLSGGEAQRIRLATQIGSGLVGVMYILDEPSIGLHLRDNSRLLKTLARLRDLGNTLIIVEHDEETIRAADHVIDMGPGAGAQGGHVVAQGPPEVIEGADESLTGQYLSGRKQIAIPETRRPGNGQRLVLKGCRQHNLKDLTVTFPLGSLICVTGVSGSGKSTLVNQTLQPVLARELNGASTEPGTYRDIEGLEALDKVVAIDQSPIGRTPRSNPATYTKVFDGIRKVFAETPEAKMRGFTKSRFSFNLKGGRCEACKGNGINQVEMHFLPDVYVPCDLCEGRRYNRETLEVRYKGKTIADVLDMRVDEALSFFQNHATIRRKLQTLQDVGLGYIRLGQPSTTLSGGEAQRVKLASELSRRSRGQTLYTLDEPTTGLHMEDIRKLIDVLDRLVTGGNTVVVIEHNLEVIKTADHVIDLGPEGGDGGGELLAQGTPEQLASTAHSYTGCFLRTVLPEFTEQSREDLQVENVRTAIKEWQKRANMTSVSLEGVGS